MLRDTADEDVDWYSSFQGQPICLATSPQVTPLKGLASTSQAVPF